MARIDSLSVATSFARAIFLTGLLARTSRYIPRSVKWIVVFLLALNIRNSPLSWHLRFMRPIIWAELKQVFVGRTKGHYARLQRLTTISPLNTHPLDVVEVWKSRAGIGDCDYNGHLSNSAYAKNLDFVRLNAAVRFFPGFTSHGVGGHIALAGTYHVFMKEIPLNQEYEILLYFGGWEEKKWVYLTAAYITRGVKGKVNGKEKESRKAEKPLLVKSLATTEALRQTTSPSSSSSIVFVPPATEIALLTPPPSGLTTPEPSFPELDPFSPSSSSSSDSGSGSPTDRQALIDAVRVKIPADATLNAIVVSQYCFKHGRITVPPRVAFIASGFGEPSRWEQLMEIRRRKDGLKEMKRLMRGGWKDEEWGNFWDFEDCEPRGRQAGDVLKKLRDVMGVVAGEEST